MRCTYREKITKVGTATEQGSGLSAKYNLCARYDGSHFGVAANALDGLLPAAFLIYR